MRNFILNCRPEPLFLGESTRIMGIVNVTPDSFSDGGDFYDNEQAVQHGVALFEQGADILDIGGESTRPYSEGVNADEELRRVIPVIEALAKKVSIPISIDTAKAAVAEAAIAAGASIINDVSALRLDSGMAGVAAKHHVPLILMHMKGTPRTMQINPTYDNLILEVRDFLKKAVETAMKSGVERSQVVIDPGIGFGKTIAGNLMLIKHLNVFSELGLPILVGSSRKKFIRSLVGNSTEEDVNPKSEIVETGTQATVAAAALNGAHIVRVHDVAATKVTLKIIDAIKNLPEE